MPRVLHPACGGLSSVGAVGAHCPAVLVAAVSLAAVLVVAVSCEAVLVVAVPLAAVLVTAVSCEAVLVAAVSLAAVLVAVLSAVQIFGDLPVFLCPFPTLDGGAAVFPLPTVLLGEPLVVDVCLSPAGQWPTFYASEVGDCSWSGSLAHWLPRCLAHSRSRFLLAPLFPLMLWLRCWVGT
ncbi:hypothetical protein NDU88_002562 [Pleurodeles waltl]|uniref:Uncharacterized protein n=1 Tax=Pleurodeles waltl TaxID=8319 RepID=A0AAV7M6C7_PLEWA|nr:hypothetical protein NDU88_002562 [Pleurodeles waltl]